MDSSVGATFPSDPGVSIVTNLVFSGSVGVLLLGVFIVLRRPFAEVYSSNILSKKKKLQVYVRNGNISWLKTIGTMPDDELLAWVGLDAFIFIQTLKLLLVLTGFLAVLAILILLPGYSLGRTTTDASWFERFTITHIRTAPLLWLPLVFNYLSTLLVFYAVHLFYRNLTVYRQAYMRCPAAFVAQVSMRKLARNLGSVDGASSLLNLTGRALVVRNVGARYSRSQLAALFEQMGLEDISSVIIVQNRRKVKKILESRNDVHVELERALLEFYHNVLTELATKRAITGGALEAEYLQKEFRIPSLKKIEILKRLLSPKVLTTLRPRHTTKHSKINVDSITYLYDKLMLLDRELADVARRFASENDHYDIAQSSAAAVAAAGPGSAVDESDASSRYRMAETDVLLRQKSLVSLKQVVQVGHNMKEYRLTLWGTSMSIIAIFGSQRSATIGSQCLLSSRPFSMEVHPAPTADNIIWSNLYLPEADRFVRILFGDLLYLLVNLMFTTINAAISQLLSLSELQRLIPPLSRVLAQWPGLGPVLSGILAPLFYNLFLVAAPFLIYGLSVYQGYVSKPAAEFNLMRKYTWLLFLQAFLVAVIPQTMLAIISQVLGGQSSRIISNIQQMMPSQSAFFLNVIIQKALITSGLLLLRPGSLLFWVIAKFLRSKSPRDKEKNSEPQTQLMGALYPNYILLVFITLMAFLSINPLIALAGCLFYAISYYVFRYQFIYCYEVPAESGGQYWTFMPTGLLIGCLLGQGFSALQFVFLGGTMQAVFLVPLAISTVFLIMLFGKVFRRKSEYVPLGPEDVARVEAFIESAQERQRRLVGELRHQLNEDYGIDSGPGPESPLDEAPPEKLGQRTNESVPFNFADAGSSSFSEHHPPDLRTSLENPYSNPVVFKRHSRLLLPPCFFHLFRDAITHLGTGREGQPKEHDPVL